MIDNSDVPILFKFLRDKQDGEDDDGDDIWFNISTPIDSALCEQHDLQRFNTQDYLKLQGYISSDLYQGEDEELFLIKQFQQRNNTSKTKSFLQRITDFVDIYILGSKDKITSKVEVHYNYINFLPYILQDKLERLRAADSADEAFKVNSKARMTMFKLANFTQQLMHSTTGEIRSQQVLRQVINHQFSLTSRWFTFHFFLFVVGYVVPLGLQIQSNARTEIMIENIICLVVQVYLLSLEFMQVLDQGPEYLLEFYNLVDITEFILYVGYFVMRMQNTYLVLPDEFHLEQQLEHSEARSWMPLIHFILFIQALIRTMFYIRVFKGIGTQVELISVTLKDSVTFMVFLIYWIWFFSIAFQLLGSEFEEDFETYTQNRINRTFTNFL